MNAINKLKNIAKEERSSFTKLADGIIEKRGGEVLDKVLMSMGNKKQVEKMIVGPRGGIPKSKIYDKIDQSKMNVDVRHIKNMLNLDK